MLSSISFSPPQGPLPLVQPHHRPVRDRRVRLTEAVYALCVVAFGVLFFITAV